MTNEEAITIITLYRAKIVNSVSIGIEEDIKAYDMALKALEQTDEDLISRQAVIDIVEFECGEWKGLAKTIVKEIEQLPSAENMAEWVSKDISDFVYCSNCDYREWYTYAIDYNYCPNCGRRMDRNYGRS